MMEYYGGYGQAPRPAMRPVPLKPAPETPPEAPATPSTPAPEAAGKPGRPAKLPDTIVGGDYAVLLNGGDRQLAGLTVGEKVYHANTFKTLAHARKVAAAIDPAHEPAVFRRIK